MNLQEQIMYLSVNPEFDCLTRRAIDLKLQELDVSGKAFIYFDLDNMKSANTQYGKIEVNTRIRESMRFRSTDIIVGQIFSGDEFVAILVQEDAYGFARRLQNSLTKHGLSATMLISNESVLSIGEEKLAKIKNAGFKSIIVDERISHA